MIWWRRVSTLLLVVALAWHGVLLSLPHDHHQDGVPRYMTSCALVGTASPDLHVHRLPQPLPSRQCLACLAGHALPHFQGSVMYAVPTPAARVTFPVPTLLTFRIGTFLPGHRGPPASA